METSDIDALVAHARAIDVDELNAANETWHVVLDARGCFAYLSEHYYRRTGFSPTDVLGKPFLSLNERDLSKDQKAKFASVLHGREPIRNFVFSRTVADGGRMVISSSGIPVRAPTGEFVGYLAVSQDVSSVVDEVYSMNLLELFDHCPLGVTVNAFEVTDRGEIIGDRIYSNRQYEELMGYRGEMTDKVPFAPSWKDQQELLKVRERLAHGDNLHMEEYARVHRNGETRWLETTTQDVVLRGRTYTLAWHRDVTETRRELQDLTLTNRQLSTLSATDALTGLANRRHLDRTLETEWQRARRDSTPLGLLLLDVDEFKRFNDHFGHPEGDRCLKAVARVLSIHTRRAGDLAARFGGEEFAVVANVGTAEQLRAHAEAIRAGVEALGLPNPESASGRVTVSIGGCLATPDRHTEAGRLVETADEALYEAKAEGRNCVRMRAFRPADD